MNVQYRTNETDKQGGLNSPNDKKLEEFRGFLSAHPRIMEVLDEVHHGMKYTTPLVVIYGPTGVGKSTLRRKFEQDLQSVAKNDELAFVSLTAQPRLSNHFSWLGFYTEALEALNDVVIDKKSLPQQHFVDPVAQVLPKTEKYRRAFERALMNRRPKVLIIDECHHFAHPTTGLTAPEQMDNLKNMAERTGVKFVFLGTYKVLEFFTGNAETERRMHRVRFQRYHAENEKEAQIFRNVLYQFQDQLPIKKGVDLGTKWKELFVNTVGCVGSLKELLYNAFVVALNDGEGKMLTWQHVTRAFKQASAVNLILEETLAGERRDSEITGAMRSQAARLGLDLGDYEADKVISQRQTKKQKRKPGKRSATRDPVVFPNPKAL